MGNTYIEVKCDGHFIGIELKDFTVKPEVTASDILALFFADDKDIGLDLESARFITQEKYEAEYGEEASMPNCAICKKPVISGHVVETECFEDLIKQLEAYKQAEKDGRIFDPLEMVKIAAMQVGFNKYKDAEDEGRLLILPLAPGKMLYFTDLHNKEIYKVAEFTGNIGLYWTSYSDIGDCVPLGCIGKTVFTSEDEALAAIREEKK